MIVPLIINEWTDLETFDEYEAKVASWPTELITAAVREIQRRESAGQTHVTQTEREATKDAQGRGLPPDWDY